jgi:hypothetical protein
MRLCSESPAENYVGLATCPTGGEPVLDKGCIESEGALYNGTPTSPRQPRFGSCDLNVSIGTGAA